MKKLLLSLTVFVASAAYVSYQYVGGSTAATTAQTASSASAPVTEQTQTSKIVVSDTTTTANTQPAQTTPTPTTPTTPKTPVTSTPTPAPVTKPKGQYVDGTYTGSPADAYYGTVQVKATIQGGKLTEVAFLQYPNDQRTSQYINSQAMPALQQEAIQAQSANVSGVSGASDTSAAFRESLASALTQAKS